jgi:hypothetical protein
MINISRLCGSVNSGVVLANGTEYGKIQKEQSHAWAEGVKDRRILWKRFGLEKQISG